MFELPREDAILDQCWTQINSMTYPRCYFTPLLYLSSINIEAQRTVEIFNAERETFSLLPVFLPSELYYGESVAFIISSELCILTNCKQMVR